MHVCHYTYINLQSPSEDVFHYTIKGISIRTCNLYIMESITVLLNVAFTILKTDLVTAHTEFLKSFIS